MWNKVLENSVFELNWKKFFWEWNKIYNAETGEIILIWTSEFIEVSYDETWYASHKNYYLFFTQKDSNYEMWWCNIQWYIMRNDVNDNPSQSIWKIEIEELYETFYSSNYECWSSNFTYSWNYYEDNYSPLETYPWKSKNLKKYSTEFAEKIELPKENPPKDNNPPKEDTWSGTQEPPKDWTQDQTIKNEIKTENQFFKDIELKNFDFKYQEITKNWQLYIVQDSTEYQNYIANKVNEFTLFTYIAVFFFVTFFTFNFIKNMLWK